MPEEHTQRRNSCWAIATRSQPAAVSCPATVRRISLALTFTLVIIGLSACASQRLSRDPLCKEIARFANSTKPGETRVVSLETAWGPSGKHPDSFRSVDCNHNGNSAGARLCGYLLENSATEFSYYNFLAAFACLSGSPDQPKNHVAYHRLEIRVSAYGAIGVREGVELSLDFKPNEVNGTMQLDIGATALK
jgi:hypothetical protein